MTAIGKNDLVNPSVDDFWRSCLKQIVEGIEAASLHPARTVVLVPYAQLMAVGRAHWARLYPNGFAPQFETTHNWAARCATWLPQSIDWTGDVSRDGLTARSLLDRAGLRSMRDLLAAPLMEAMRQLASCVAAMHPADRPEWVDQRRPLMQGVSEFSGLSIGAADNWLRYESVVNTIALEWAQASGYPTDVLFTDEVLASVDALMVIQGFQEDLLAQALLHQWRHKWAQVWQSPAVDSHLKQQTQCRWHQASDAEDEALRAAACVSHHLGLGHTPVALVSIDRALTRRIQAHLHTSGISVRDENGWTLSTTRSAATVMAWLQACTWNASTDSVLDALKQLPSIDLAALNALECALRFAGLRAWRQVMVWKPSPQRCPLPAHNLVQQVQRWRQAFCARHSLRAWLQKIRDFLVESGLWAFLSADTAGCEVLKVLHLHPKGEQEEGDEASFLDEHTMDLAQLTSWVRDVLEAARFKPVLSQKVAVVVVPLAQLLARSFSAVVIPGCDEKRLPLSPEPVGAWTRPQRQALGLPTREALALAQQSAWWTALGAAWVEVLWRTGDDAGEKVLPSPLVLAAQIPQGAADFLGVHREDHGVPVLATHDFRWTRSITPEPTMRPSPSGQALDITTISSSAYSDLRACPYRFLALRQWGLTESPELDTMLEKRDFGTWLHTVLQHFHESEADISSPDPAGRVHRMNLSAQWATQKMGMNAGEFLPFAAAWDRLRDGYLVWLLEHEAQGAVFMQAEQALEQPLPSEQVALTLRGTIDRVDQAPPLAVDEEPRSQPPVMMLIDYKTESLQRTKDRIKEGLEDTQLAFYAALLPQAQALRAAYVNVGERGQTLPIEQTDILLVRDALLEGLASDFSRISAGAPLLALGEGSVCEYCSARGLCRKDFWS